MAISGPKAHHTRAFAIDLNPRHGGYWLWQKNIAEKKLISYKI
jgi:hypothetical protein